MTTIKSRKYKYFVVGIICIILSSCQATSFLKENETFQRKNKLILKSKLKIQDKSLLQEELQTFIVQKPNQSILWINRQWFYYVFKDKKSKFSKTILNYFGQPPSIFDEKAAQETEKNIETFLRNKRGFYNARVTHKSYSKKFTTDVVYNVDLGTRSIISTFKYECKDSAILKILNNSIKGSFLNPGEPVNSSNYDLEKVRITNILQQNGYALFEQKYLYLQGDSTKNKVDLVLKINLPENQDSHTIFRVGKIRIFTDYYASQNTHDLDSIIYENKIYYKELKSFIVDPHVLSDAFSLNEGEIYSKNFANQVYDKLSQIAVYKFVTIKTSIDSLKPNEINYNFYLYLNENKYSHEENIGIKYLTLSANEQLIEGGVNGLIYDRRLTKRGDNLSFSGNGKIKVNILDTLSIRELDFASKLDYNYPNTLNSIKISPIYIYSKLIHHEHIKKLKNETITNLSFQYDYQDILGKFLFSSLNVNFGYNYISKKDGVRIYFNQAGINYFKSIIIDNSLFKSSFQVKSLGDFFQTAFLFKNLAIEVDKVSDFKTLNAKYIYGLELSGMEIFLANQLFNAITNQTYNWKITKEIDFAKFIKIYADIRPLIRLNRNDELAFRIYTGFGTTFNKYTSLPYIKLYEAGGPTSMRAWAARDLGPGSYHDSKTIVGEYPFQKGDVRLETNAEYRFKFNSIFRGAIFVDAGNIWTLGYDSERLGSQFTGSFYKQIAVDAGFSIQLKLFILLRFDFAFKLRHPYSDVTKGYWHVDSLKPTFVFSINNPF